MKEKDPENFILLTQQINEMLYQKDNINNYLLQTQAAQFAATTNLILKSSNDDENLASAAKTLQQLNGKTNAILTNLIHNNNTGLEAVNHGDLWMNNFLISNADGEPDDVKFVDLQLMRYSSIAADLSYFLYVNLEPHVLAESMDPLLSFYQNLLVENARMQGVNLENTLIMPRIKEEMRRFALFGMVSALWIMPVFYFKAGLEDKDWELRRIGPKEKRRMEEVVLYYVRCVSRN